MNVYKPREDSYLLKDHVESLQLEGKDVLDMGTGTGIIAVAAAKKGANVTAVDINSDALEIALEKAKNEGVENSIKFTHSDLFEHVKGEYDYIFFNPPYLAGRRENDQDPLIGGEKGVELTRRYLEQSTRYLKPDGDIFFIVSSLAEWKELEDDFDLTEVNSEELWFETLRLLRLGN